MESHGLSVCLLIAFKSRVKTAEPIITPLGGWLGWAQVTIIRRGPDPQVEAAIFGVTAPLKSMGNHCLLLPARIFGQTLTIYTSYDMFPHKEVPFGSRVNNAPISEAKYNKQSWGRE